MAKMYSDRKISFRLMVNGRVEKYTTAVPEGVSSTKPTAEIVAAAAAMSMTAKRDCPGALNSKGEVTNTANEKGSLTVDGIREIAEKLAAAAGIKLPKNGK